MSKAQLQREQSSVGLCEPPSDLLVDKKEVADAVLSANPQRCPSPRPGLACISGIVLAEPSRKRCEKDGAKP
jgi:hypothetical protein